MTTLSPQQPNDDKAEADKIVQPQCQHPYATSKRPGKRYCANCNTIIYDSYEDYVND